MNRSIAVIAFLAGLALSWVMTDGHPDQAPGVALQWLDSVIENWGAS